MRLNLHFKTPTLQQLSLIKVSDIVVSQLFKYNRENKICIGTISNLKEWEKISLLIENAMQVMLVPNVIKPNLFEVVIQMWNHVQNTFSCSLHFDDHPAYPHLTDMIWENLCFKSRGEVDMDTMVTKTFRNIIQHKVVDLAKDFELACKFGRKDVAIEIFNKMSEVEKEGVCMGKDNSVCASFWHDQVCNCESDEERDMDFYSSSLIEYLDRECPNQCGVTYFWESLDEKQQDMILGCLDYAIVNKLPRLVFSSLPNIEINADVAHHYGSDIFHCLMQWPYCELLLPTIACLLDYLPDACHSVLFRGLMQNRCLSRCSMFQTIVQEFWQMCHQHTKCYILSDEQLCKCYLLQLLRVRDYETFEILFKDVCEKYDCKDKEEFLGEIDYDAFSSSFATLYECLDVSEQ